MTSSPSASSPKRSSPALTSASKMASTTARCFAGTDHFGRGFRAGQQTQGVDDNRLSGAGFAGKQVETGIEVKFELIDESKISDAKKPQHTRGL